MVCSCLGFRMFMVVMVINRWPNRHHQHHHQQYIIIITIFIIVTVLTGVARLSCCPNLTSPFTITLYPPAASLSYQLVLSSLHIRAQTTSLPSQALVCSGTDDRLHGGRGKIRAGGSLMCCRHIGAPLPPHVSYTCIVCFAFSRVMPSFPPGQSYPTCCSIHPPSLHRYYFSSLLLTPHSPSSLLKAMRQALQHDRDRSRTPPPRQDDEDRDSMLNMSLSDQTRHYYIPTRKFEVSSSHFLWQSTVIPSRDPHHRSDHTYL